MLTHHTLNLLLWG